MSSNLSSGSCPLLVHFLPLLQGLLSPESHQLQQRLRSLHPMEALSVMASVIQDAAEAATEPASAHVLAQVRERAFKHSVGATPGGPAGASC